MQLYWQSFPAAGGRDRTTYAFTYADIDRRRPSLEVRCKLASQLPAVSALLS